MAISRIEWSNVIFQESYDRFLEIAETNPIGALNNAVVDLVRGMQIGSYLVEKGMMPANKGKFFF